MEVTSRSIRFPVSEPLAGERTEEELACLQRLRQLHIEYQMADHPPAATIEDCLIVDEVMQTHICKNLFLCNAQKTAFYLLMLPGDKVFKTKDLSKQIGSSRLSFAPEEYMWQYLRVHPGSVTVLGLMNDPENRVKLLIDRDLFQEPYVGCHPCINTSSLKIKLSDILEKFLPAVGHTYTVVSL